MIRGIGGFIPRPLFYSADIEALVVDVWEGGSRVPRFIRQ